jgi:hypothetical protein
MNACPRCTARIVQCYATEPPGCVTCGWEDYIHPLPKRERKRDGLLGGLATKVRYIGFAKALEDLTVAVRVRRDTTAMAGIVTVPKCPYDLKDMKVVPKSGYGVKKRERTYRCPTRHRVILVSSENGDLRGWM